MSLWFCASSLDLYFTFSEIAALIFDSISFAFFSTKSLTILILDSKNSFSDCNSSILELTIFSLSERNVFLFNLEFNSDFKSLISTKKMKYKEPKANADNAKLTTANIRA